MLQFLKIKYLYNFETYFFTAFYPEILELNLESLFHFYFYKSENTNSSIVLKCQEQKARKWNS